MSISADGTIIEELLKLHKYFIFCRFINDSTTTSE